MSKILIQYLRKKVRQRQQDAITMMVERIGDEVRMNSFVCFYIEYRHERKLVVNRRIRQQQQPLKPNFKSIRFCYKFGYSGSDAASILI